MAKQMASLDRQEASIALREKEEKDRKEASKRLRRSRQGGPRGTLFDSETGVDDELATSLGVS